MLISSVLWYNKPNKSKIAQAFHILLGFAENQTVYRDFKIRNSVRITEGSDNGDSDNQGSTVLNKIKIAVRILSRMGRIYDENMMKIWCKYDENMINVWWNYCVINSVLKNQAVYSNNLTVK